MERKGFVVTKHRRQADLFSKHTQVRMPRIKVRYVEPADACGGNLIAKLAECKVGNCVRRPVPVLVILQCGFAGVCEGRRQLAFGARVGRNRLNDAGDREKRYEDDSV